MNKSKNLFFLLLLLNSTNSLAYAVNDRFIIEQQDKLLESTKGKGFGPQSPRDIDNLSGDNSVIFSLSPHYTKMNLCNIHFHKNAEHKGGEFTLYSGNGDGKGNNTGYKYNGNLTKNELRPFAHSELSPGDTIEVHYVHSSADVKPGPTLGACLSDSISNPQLRVEAQVYVLVNDPKALDFVHLTRHGWSDGYYQAFNIPDNTGKTIQYLGSTTGPSYNEKASPLQVTWSVRPRVAKVSIRSVSEWLKDNDFDENHAHGVRNLIINKELLSPIYN
ncbi:delta-class carbonic anhydrase [Vibrio vulnificus]|uniref:delta-class carbonic anhydrase n=1 Tax=Vibrio vulnificus TaxID=672 RepID=UPI001CDD703E|nr:delta-class carbonic anhydrase [Vibrio vulnificus]MCA3966642.1 hypothetical protein [Vibrio vulnificus]